MSVSSLLVISGVRASFQLYAAGDRALARRLRDKPILLPDAVGPMPISDERIIEQALDEWPAFKAQLAADNLLQLAETLFANWEDLPPDQRAKDLAVLRDVYEVVKIHEADPDLSDRGALDQLAKAKISQWAADDATAPDLQPWQEFALAFGQVALDFVGTNPSVFQAGGDSERLIDSFATAAGQMLDDPTFSDTQFGAQILSVTLRAGLQTLSDERGLIFDDAHIQELVQATTAPVITALSDPALSGADRHRWKELARGLSGPVAQAVFGVVAAHPEAFLGDEFAAEELLGKRTQSLFQAAHQGAFHDLLADPDEATVKAAALTLFQTLAGVAAVHPDLIIRGAATDDVLRDLLNGAAAAVTEAEHIDNALGLAIAAAGFDALAKNAPALVTIGGDGAPWGEVAGTCVQQILTGLSDVTTEERKMETMMSKAQLVSLTRVMFEQVAKTPHMLKGDHTELEAVIAAIGTAIAEEDRGLMTSDDWLQIAAVAVREAGRNPGRLFGFDPAGQSLASKALGQLLAAAANSMTLGARGGHVLFGETLRIAIETALAALSDNSVGASRVLNSATTLQDLAEQISVVIAEQENDLFQYGAREWLALWRAELSVLLEDGEAFVALAEVVPPGAGGAVLRGTITVANRERVLRTLKGSD